VRVDVLEARGLSFSRMLDAPAHGSGFGDRAGFDFCRGRAIDSAVHVKAIK
jgi:hypothetical protein